MSIIINFRGWHLGLLNWHWLALPKRKLSDTGALRDWILFVKSKGTWYDYSGLYEVHEWSELSTFVGQSHGMRCLTLQSMWPVIGWSENQWQYNKSGTWFPLPEDPWLCLELFMVAYAPGI